MLVEIGGTDLVAAGLRFSEETILDMKRKKFKKLSSYEKEKLLLGQKKRSVRVAMVIDGAAVFEKTDNSSKFLFKGSTLSGFKTQIKAIKDLSDFSRL